jgi:hypothetical protein
MSTRFQKQKSGLALALQNPEAPPANHVSPHASGCNSAINRRITFTTSAKSQHQVPYSKSSLSTIKNAIIPSPPNQYPPLLHLLPPPTEPKPCRLVAVLLTSDITHHRQEGGTRTLEVSTRSISRIGLADANIRREAYDVERWDRRYDFTLGRPGDRQIVCKGRFLMPGI